MCRGIRWRLLLSSHSPNLNMWRIKRHFKIITFFFVFAENSEDLADCIFIGFRHIFVYRRVVYWCTSMLRLLPHLYLCYTLPLLRRVCNAWSDLCDNFWCISKERKKLKKKKWGSRRTMKRKGENYYILVKMRNERKSK